MITALHVSWEYPPYRIIGQLAWKVQELVRSLRDFCKLAVVHPGPENKKYTDNGIEVYMFRDTGYLRKNFIVYSHELVYEALIKLPYLLPYSGFTVVHGHEWIGGMIALVLARAFRNPFVLSIYSLERTRSSMDNMLSFVIESIENCLLEEADYILCHHEDLSNDLYKCFGEKVIKCNAVKDVQKLYLKIVGATT